MQVDEGLGLVKDYFTEPAGELAVLLYSQLPARTCSDLCRRIGGMTLTESTLQRLARETVEAWDEVSQDALEEIRDEEGIPEGAVGACVSLDGVMVPMREVKKRFPDNQLQGGILRHAYLVRRNRSAKRRWVIPVEFGPANRVPINLW